MIFDSTFFLNKKFLFKKNFKYGSKWLFVIVLILLACIFPLILSIRDQKRFKRSIQVPQKKIAKSYSLSDGSCASSRGPIVEAIDPYHFTGVNFFTYENKSKDSRTKLALCAKTSVLSDINGRLCTPQQKIFIQKSELELLKKYVDFLCLWKTFYKDEFFFASELTNLRVFISFQNSFSTKFYILNLFLKYSKRLLKKTFFLPMIALRSLQFLYI